MSNLSPGAISIAATFTAEPILKSLSFVLEQAGIPLEVRFAPYHRVFQELLSDSSLLAKSVEGINVLLIRLEDFVRDESRENVAVAIIERSTEELGSAFASFALRAKVPTIVSILPPSPRAGRLLSTVAAANTRLNQKVSTLPGVILLASQEIDRFCGDNQFDAVSDALAHVPFSRDYYASLALAIARKSHAALVPPHKVLVLDCDNTLWQGVVGEDGINGIRITAACAKLQQFAVKCHSEGTLICLVSKNNECDALDVFKDHSDMVLKLDHVVTHRINWGNKPQNIISIAKELNLGLDSFVFLDDNPVECALMRSELPQVVTLQTPPEERMDAFLANLWTFDKLAVTDEDQRRTQLYKEDAERQAFEASAADIGDFVASLDVCVDIRPPTEMEWPRLAQLTQRTNQFNFTTKRKTEPQLRAVAANRATVLRINVSDRFGDYGLVGLVVAQFEPDRLNVDTFLLSCRVLGRGVEHAVLRELGAIANTRKLSFVAINYEATAKNEPARAFIESVASQFRVSEDDRSYLIPAAKAARITHRPGFDPEALIEASRSTSVKIAANTGVPPSARYDRLAEELVRGEAISVAVNLHSARPRSLPGTAILATNDTERRLLKLWEDLLGVSGIGVDDDYAASGGTSLVAAGLFAEIARQFSVKLPLTTILSCPTVRKLARQIGAQNTSVFRAVIELKPGSSRNLFMVHDGDGETLLYGNLARRLPDDVAVFGINPVAQSSVPLAHTRVEDMAAAYIKRAQEWQPEGPYLLGGMCAGGVIAYEMARQLINQGERVELVLILDAATPQARHKPHLATRNRITRLSQLIRNAIGSEVSASHKLRRILFDASKKVWNVMAWEITNTLIKWSVIARFRLLRAVVSQELPWPSALPALSARQIYESAETSYVPKPFAGSEVVLLRASVGDSGDTPYVKLYADSTLGWGSVVRDLNVADVDGGHFSMLQEPYVANLAEIVCGLLAKQGARPLVAVDEPA